MSHRCRRFPTLAALALASSLGSLPARGEGPATPAGRWEGEVDVGLATTTVVLRLAEEAGAWSGSLDVPAQGTTGLDLTDLRVDGARLTFSVPGLAGSPTFIAELDPAGAVLRGTLTREDPAPPATDIFLVSLAPDGAALDPGAPPRNLTDRKGYDNQPAFLADGAEFVYTSIRKDQADLYRRALDGSGERPLTSTPESEYSPTPMPGGTSLSTVRVEADGTQRLWRVPLSGGEPEPLLPGIQPVGYHAWLDADTLALFVLDEPPTLQIASLAGGTGRVVAEGIGRSLHRVPGRTAVSYVRKVSEEDWRIEVHDPADGTTATLGATLPGREDFCWTPDGAHLLMADGTKLYRAAPGAGEGLRWEELGDLAGAGVAEVTRLAPSPDGRRLLVVGAPPAPERTTETVAFELRRMEGER